MLLPIGDAHVRKEDIEEATKFIKWTVSGILDINKQTGKKVVPLFLGDQYHNFGNKNVDVEKFWKWAFEYILKNLGYPALGLVGNHDMNQEETANSMDVHDGTILVIGAEGAMLTPTTGAVGFIRSEDKFHAKVMELYNKGARTIFCHAEFDGCQFESGYYSPHGFKLDRYPADLKFYSGHVHLKQEFGNIFYFGTPRHLTKSDIGELKGVHLMNLADRSLTFYETPRSVWSPFIRILVDEDKPDEIKAAIEATEGYAKEGVAARIYVEIRGTKEFVKKMEKGLPGGVRTTPTYTDEAVKVTVKESEGIPATFAKFSTEFFAINQTPPDIQAEVLDRVHKLCPSLKVGV